MIKTYVELGMGIGIVAEMAYSAEQDKSIICLEQENLIPPNIASIAVRHGTFLRGYAIAFIQTLIPDLSSEAIRTAVEGSSDMTCLPCVTQPN